MKKIIGVFSLAAVLTIMACADNKPAVVKKEVIVVPPSPVIVTKDLPKKPTTILLDKNGVKVETKKVDVTLKKQ
jgi:hypothetical protein